MGTCVNPDSAGFAGFAGFARMLKDRHAEAARIVCEEQLLGSLLA